MSASSLTVIFSNPNPNLNPLSRITSSNYNSNASCNFDLRVYAKAANFEVKLTNSVANVRGYGQFSAPVIPSSPDKKSKDDEDGQNYHVNLGYAIRSLREDFPALFYRELSFDIYRDDIIFKDPMNKLTGIENYKSIFWALRFNGRIFFRALWIEITSLRQPEEGIITVRWTIHGVPRVLWESRVRFDGSSEYKLDKMGKIYEHKVDNIVVNSPPKLQASAVDQLIQALGYSSTPKPTCFEISSYSTSSCFPLMDRNSSPYLVTDQDYAFDSRSVEPQTSQRS